MRVEPHDAHDRHVSALIDVIARQGDEISELHARLERCTENNGRSWEQITQLREERDELASRVVSLEG